MKLPVRDGYGKEVRSLEVDETVFGIMPNGAVLHQAYVAQRANQRWGTASTKTRGEVQGSTRKIRRQKYTGSSRQGGIRAPHRVGGGIAFGPKPRDYSQALNKKMRRLAIRSALSGKVADGQLVIIDQLAFETPKTKQMLETLRNNGIERSALIVTAASDRKVMASARNLPKTKVLPAAYLNIVDMMHHNGVLITEEAVRIAEALWGKDAGKAVVAEKPKRARTAKAAVEAPQTPPAAPEKPAAKPKRAAKPAAKVAAEKPVAEVVVEAPIAEAPAAEAPAAEAPPKARRVVRKAEPKAAAKAEKKPAKAPTKRARATSPVLEAPPKARRVVKKAELKAAAAPTVKAEKKPAKAPAKRAPAKAKAPKAAPAAKAEKKHAKAPAKRAPAKVKAPKAAAKAATEEAKPKRRTRKAVEGEG